MVRRPHLFEVNPGALVHQCQLTDWFTLKYVTKIYTIGLCVNGSALLSDIRSHRRLYNKHCNCSNWYTLKKNQSST